MRSNCGFCSSCHAFVDRNDTNCSSGYFLQSKVATARRMQMYLGEVWLSLPAMCVVGR